MKTLTNFLNESYTAKSWNKIIDKHEVTLETIENAKGFGSFMDDRAWAVVDDNTYEKIGKNKWQKHSNGAHTLSGTITDKEFFNIIQNCKEFKLELPE